MMLNLEASCLLPYGGVARLFYRALLQKRPIILRSLLIVATPALWQKAAHIGNVAITVGVVEY